MKGHNNSTPVFLLGVTDHGYAICLPSVQCRKQNISPDFIDLIFSVVYNRTHNGPKIEPRSALLWEESDETGEALSAYGRDTGAGAAVCG